MMSFQRVRQFNWCSKWPHHSPKISTFKTLIPTNCLCGANKLLQSKPSGFVSLHRRKCFHDTNKNLKLYKTELDESDVVKQLEEFCSDVYKSLQHLPWISTLPNVAFVQLTLNQCVETHLKWVNASPVLLEVRSHLNELSDSLTPPQLSRILNSLILLGVPPTDHLVQTLLFKLIPKISTLELHDGLSSSCQLLRKVTPYNYNLIRHALHRLDQFPSELKTSMNPIADLCEMSNCIYFAIRFITKDYQHQVLNMMSECLDNNNTDLSFDQISSLSCLLFNFVSFDASHTADHKFVKLTSHLANQLHADLSRSEASPSEKFGRWMTVLLPRSAPLRQLRNHHVYRLLPQTNKIVDLVQLLSVCDRSTGMKHELTSAILRNIGQADVHTLTILCERMIYLRLCNNDVLQAFSQALASQLPSVLQCGSRLYFMIRRLSLIQHPQLEMVLVPALLPLLRDTVLLSMRRSFVLMEYLLSRLQQPMDRKLFDRCQYLIRRSVDSDLFPQTVAFVVWLPLYTHSQSSRKHPKLYNQLCQLQQIAFTLSQVSARSCNVNQLVSMTRCLIPTRTKPTGLTSQHVGVDRHLLDSLLSHCILRAGEMKPKTLIQLSSSLFGAFMNHIPAIHVIGEQLLNYTDELSFNDLNIFLRGLSLFGVQSTGANSFCSICSSVGTCVYCSYHPSMTLQDPSLTSLPGIPSPPCELQARQTELSSLPIVQVILERFKQEHSSLDVLQRFVVLSRLASLLVFPEDILKEMFSLETMVEVDDFVDANPHTQKRAAALLLQLNRAVVLDYPQLQMHWFHAHTPHAATRPWPHHNERDFFSAEVSRCLSSALGGSQFIRKDSFAPYGYSIDIECALLDGEPLPMHLLKDVGRSNRRKLERVAVLPLGYYQLARWVPVPLGKNQTRIRHLQLLGYRVVQVPFNEWNSLQLSTEQQKINYLRTKILKPLA